MPNQLQKSLQDYLSKRKKPTPQIQSPSTSTTLTSSSGWILRGCKHPKTPSFAFDLNNQSETKQEATLSDVDRFVLENFKSFYKKEEDGKDSVEIKRDHEARSEEEPIGILFESPRFTDPPEINICGSHRFFIPPAGSSVSLIEEARTSLTTSTLEEVGSSSTTTTTRNSARTSDDDTDKLLNPEDFITVLKYSSSPYYDFKKSMYEMIEARMHHTGKIDWEFMEELLFCYLNLNDKNSCKFILTAFVDLVVFLRENSGRVPAKPRSVRSNSGRRRRKNNLSINQEM